MIKLNFKKLTRVFKHIRHGDKEDINLERDWQIILAGFLFILALAVILNIYIFWFYHGEKYLVGLGQTATQDSIKINTVSLEKILNRLEQKKKITEENYLTPNINDPSL